MKLWNLLLLIGIGVASLSGCAKPSEITGEVKFQDGSPLMHGRLEFKPKGESTGTGFWAQLTEDGTFVVDPGLAPMAGEYVVTLSNAQTPEVIEEDAKGNHTVKAPAKQLVDDKKYGDASKSPLTATVEPGKNELTLTVDRLP